MQTVAPVVLINIGPKAQDLYFVGLDRYRVSGDGHQYRLVSVSGDTFLRIAAGAG
jgi:hypothetical protein